MQLTVPHRSTDCSDVALATMIGGLAALEVLAFLDGGLPASIEATLEVTAARSAGSPAELAASPGLHLHARLTSQVSDAIVDPV